MINCTTTFDRAVFLSFFHTRHLQALLFKKSLTVKERANAALASLQRNAYAMGMLRSRLESRINFILNENGGKTEGYQELTRVLELVKNGEMILNEMSEKVESARFLEEFIMIIDSAASSVSEIKGDIEQLVPMAEAALSEMHDAISRVSAGMMSPELRQEIEPAILAEASAAMAAATSSAATVEAKNEQAESEPKEEEPEGVAV
jgi:hypothetical protein